MSILLLTATAMEGDRLVAAIENPVQQTRHHRRWVSGAWGTSKIWCIEGGLGAANTAHALTMAFETLEIDRVLQVGVGGAYDGSGLSIGDLAVAGSDSYADLGVLTPEGWHGADLIGVPVVETQSETLYNTYPCDPEATRQARVALAPHFHVRQGPFATVQEVSGTRVLGDERLRRVPGAICESMEGAAAAHLCTLYGVRFVELRAISNAVEDRDRSRWDLPLASTRAQEGAELLLQQWTQ